MSPHFLPVHQRETSWRTAAMQQKQESGHWMTLLSPKYILVCMCICYVHV